MSSLWWTSKDTDKWQQRMFDTLQFVVKLLYVQLLSGIATPRFLMKLDLRHLDDKLKCIEHAFLVSRRRPRQVGCVSRSHNLIDRLFQIGFQTAVKLYRLCKLSLRFSILPAQQHDHPAICIGPRVPWV
jgi:hypothetical protein